MKKNTAMVMRNGRLVRAGRIKTRIAKLRAEIRTADQIHALQRREQELRRQVAELRSIITDAQWVCPISNTSDSCAGCGRMRHLSCELDCPVAAVSGDYGGDDDV